MEWAGQIDTHLDTAGLVARLAERWAGEPFVRVLPAGQLPSTAHVRGSNVCLLGAAVDRRAGRLIVVSALDNLVKGASGQAIQAANVAIGLPESTGLTVAPLFP
jgi:N-acetyl-gamma-glutamyl-phosphate reductase